MRDFHVGKRIVFGALAFGTLSFMVFAKFYATTAQLRFIGGHNLDKLAHISGGAFLAMFYEWRKERPILWQFLLLVLAISVGWEAYEYFFDAETIYFRTHMPDLWRLDTAGDITAAFLGGYGYWVFFRHRKGK